MGNSLEGRVALVTGGSRGIGRAIAVALAEAGADVVVNYLRQSEEAHAVELEIQRLHHRCAVIQGNVSRANDVQRLVRESEETLGSVDILVNNAGISRPQPIEEITEQDWEDILTVNLKSCFLVTQAVLPAMRKKKWGRIINISSVAAQVGGIVGPHYAASKAGMLGMTHFYASRLAREGITVNAIAPALIETDMVAANPNARPEQIPIGRFGLPLEVADVAVLLAGNGYINGQTINVNGGWFMS
jgi:3-oxoacyl-[acyl-carrier protein] reductase